MTDTAIRGVLVPFAILALAFAILFVAGQAGTVDDPALWTIVGLWIGAPVVGGLASRTLSTGQITVAAAVLAVVVGFAVAGFFLTAAGTASSCKTEGLGSAEGYFLGCFGVGTIVGSGVGASELVTARLARAGRWMLGVPLGGMLSFGASASAYLLYYAIVTCLR